MKKEDKIIEPSIEERKLDALLRIARALEILAEIIPDE